MGAITKEEQKRKDELLAKGLKVCGKCGRVLPIEQFNKDKSKKDGLQSKCRECDNQYHRSRRKGKGKGKGTLLDLVTGLKKCNCCEQYKPASDFSKNKTKKDGLEPRCKDCHKPHHKQYYQEHKEERRQHDKQYYQEHREQKLQYQNQYYQENKEKIQQYQQENKEKRRQQRQQYYQQNKEKIQQYKQQYMKQYYQENKEKRQQYNKQYHQQNKEKIQRHYQTPQGQIVTFNAQARRRRREVTQGNGITKEQWMEMMNFFDWKCAYSDKSIGYKKNRSIDHIVPLVKGGANEIWNLVPMYRPYNSSKQDKDMMEWYTAQDFYSKERLDKILAWQEYAYNKYGKQDKEFAL